MNVKRKGGITELQVIAILMEHGDVSIPYGESARYDCIWEYKNKLYKIQIKTAKIKRDAMYILLSNSRQSRSGNIRKIYTAQEVDFVATYYNGCVYMVHPDMAKVFVALQFAYPTDGTREGIKLVEDYSLEKTLLALS